jgi:hypothetical protein
VGLLLASAMSLLVRAEGGVPQLARRRVFPEVEPQLCVTLISYESATVKLDGLAAVYDRVVRYLDEQVAAELGSDGRLAPLRYELLWLDNASSEGERARFRAQRPQVPPPVGRWCRAVAVYHHCPKPTRCCTVVCSIGAEGTRTQIERVLLRPSNLGLYGAMNEAWFGPEGCRAPYVLSVEDDWLVRSQPWELPHIALAAALLRSDDTLSGVRLKVRGCLPWSRRCVLRTRQASSLKDD